jgi:hypothetical protein
MIRTTLERRTNGTYRHTNPLIGVTPLNMKASEIYFQQTLHLPPQLPLNKLPLQQGLVHKCISPQYSTLLLEVFQVFSLKPLSLPLPSLFLIT